MNLQNGSKSTIGFMATSYTTINPKDQVSYLFVFVDLFFKMRIAEGGSLRKSIKLAEPIVISPYLGQGLLLVVQAYSYSLLFVRFYSFLQRHSSTRVFPDSETFPSSYGSPWKP